MKIQGGGATDSPCCRWPWLCLQTLILTFLLIKILGLRTLMNRSLVFGSCEKRVVKSFFLFSINCIYIIICIMHKFCKNFLLKNTEWQSFSSPQAANILARYWARGIIPSSCRTQVLTYRLFLIQ